MCVGEYAPPPRTPRRLLECEMAERNLADTIDETGMNMETRMHIVRLPVYIQAWSC